MKRRPEATVKRALHLLILVAAVLCGSALAHEVRPAYLELRQTAAETYDALWKVPGRGEDLRLGLYVELPADSTNVTEPRGAMVNNAFTERWSVQRAGGLTGGTIRIDGLSATMTDVLVRLERLDGSTQVTRLTPSAPSFVVEAAPRATEVAGTYLVLGIEHILGGVDHLLFVLALLILVKGTRRLIWTVTAFTIAHSLTLAGATLGFVDVPAPPVEAAIALSIVFVAAEIIRSREGKAGLTERFPWVVAFIFGLLHGFGFASALNEEEFAMKRSTLKVLACVIMALAACAVRAQDYPNRPVKIIVPFAAGGPADVYARFLAQRLQEAMGQPFVVEDRPGAGSVTGTDAVAKSAPDGYTLLLMSNAQTVNESLIPNKPYALLRDFAPVSPINYSDLVLVVHPAVAANSLADLIRIAKASPGKLNYASSGPGTPYHMAGELFKAMAGVDIVHIPYKGSSGARTDVLGGQVDMMFDAVTTMNEYAKAGRVRPLATTGKARSSVLPNVPTMNEAGVAGYEAVIWLGVMAPKATPPAIVNRLNAEIRRIVAAARSPR